MAIPLPSEDDLARAVAAISGAGGVLAHASEASGIPCSTLRRWRDLAAKKGMFGTGPVLPGFEISRTSAQIGENGKPRH